tara:strand:- start:66 stop:1202 length:1137 start_codon:yes stop_codon:yes gene_type:complete
MNPNEKDEKKINKNIYEKLARDVLQRMFESDEKEHKKFVHELFEKYKELEKTKNGKYSQDWTAYNKAQSREKIILMKILDELLNYINFPKEKKVGRNPVPIRDKIFYILMQSYNEKSSRRCVSDLELARRMNYIEKTPHFNTILKCIKDTSITKHLKHLISVSGIPLQQVETDFAVDASGFSTSMFGRWFDVRLGKNSEKRKFIKAHLTCGVKTNIITAINITKGYSADSPEFKSLIDQTNRIYNIKEVSADKAYSSRKNLQTTYDLGAIPFIPFKSNVGHGTKSNTSNIWKKMYIYFTEYQQQFYHHYHKRSNCESTFNMIKCKFGSHLRSRSEIGQENEILVKCLCHNLCVLIQEAFELGIDLNFEKCADIPIAHE